MTFIIVKVGKDSIPMAGCSFWCELEFSFFILPDGWL